MSDQSKSDAPQAWTVKGSNPLFTHPRITLVEDTVELPSGVTTSWLRYEGVTDVTAVICLGDDGRVLLAEQYNHGAGRNVYEFPGGKLDPNETPQHAAARELAEEVGFRPQRLTPLGTLLHNPRRHGSRCHLFVAEGLEPTPAAPEPEEFIVTHWRTPDEIGAMLGSGAIDNMQVAAAWMHFTLWRRSPRPDA